MTYFKINLTTIDLGEMPSKLWLIE